MKKLFLITTGVLALAMANAQTKFGIKAGPNFANWAVKFEGEKDDEFKSRTGFHFGAVIDHAISEKFSIQPQVLFVSKGAGIEHEDHTDKAVVNAIDIPINFLYKAPAGSGKFFVGGGPNLGFNLSAEIKSDEEGNEKIDIGSEEGELKGFDFGVNLLAGYELANGLFFSANYTPGIANLQNPPSGVDLTARSNYFGISVGFFFGGKATAKK
ncbi:MAG: PorT family protein [Chitinophagaceae bacterium]|nr:PorT family protein [Chitinophagaceae bacterium]